MPLLNLPENLDEYTPKENEVKIIRGKHDTVTGQFLGLDNSLGYMTVRGDSNENFFDYGFSKEKSKVPYSSHKIKIPISFSTTIFNRHIMQYESGALSENVLRKVVDLCNQKFRRNADGFLARKNHDNNSLLWSGGKRVQDDRFALS